MWNKHFPWKHCNKCGYANGTPTEGEMLHISRNIFYQLRFLHLFQLHDGVNVLSWAGLGHRPPCAMAPVGKQSPLKKLAGRNSPPAARTSQRGKNSLHGFQKTHRRKKGQAFTCKGRS